MSRPSRSPYPLLGLAVVCVSLGSILVRLAAAPALAVAFYRVGLASVLLAPVGLPPLVRAWGPLPVRQRWLVLGAGAALAAHFATWIASLSFTTVASSVLLVNTAPLFTIALSRTLLREPIPRVVALATPLALAGAVLIAAGDWNGAGSLRGDALALAGAVTLSAYHVIGRGLRDALPLQAYVLGVWGSAAVVLAAVALVAGTPFGPYPTRTLLCLLGLAVVPTLGGHGLVNRALRELPAPTVGLFMLGEPVGASLLALALFGEVPPALSLAGAVLVLGALVVLARGASRT